MEQYYGFKSILDYINDIIIYNPDRDYMCYKYPKQLILLVDTFFPSASNLLNDINIKRKLNDLGISVDIYYECSGNLPTLIVIK